MTLSPLVHYLIIQYSVVGKDNVYPFDTVQAEQEHVDECVRERKAMSSENGSANGQGNATVPMAIVAAPNEAKNNASNAGPTAADSTSMVTDAGANGGAGINNMNGAAAVTNVPKNKPKPQKRQAKKGSRKGKGPQSNDRDKSCVNALLSLGRGRPKGAEGVASQVYPSGILPNGDPSHPMILPAGHSSQRRGNGQPALNTPIDFWYWLPPGTGSVLGPFDVLCGRGGKFQHS